METAQLSGLGVDLGSVVISGIGQADDVFLCANDIDCLRLLVTLTESYCRKYRVKLVPSKTKLLGYSTSSKKHLLEHAKLINPITINGQPVEFTTEAEHVGVLRNTSGNMPNIMNRIAEHKSGMSFVLSAGLAKGHNGNPAASLRVHELYGKPKLFSGLATLVMSKAETSIIDKHYQKTIMNLQRLHDKTPRCFIFLMAGCLPGEAILHQKQLSLFMMVCHLPHDPLNAHARHVLTSAKASANSWFQQIRSLCLLYELEHPLYLLESPPTKISFKKLVKQQITKHWEDHFKDEATRLSSLQYFVASRCSLSNPHIIWTAASDNSFECRKATILARMASGRFRSEHLTRHWSRNRLGYCLADTCEETVGDLEHLLVHCPALAIVRERMWKMFYEHSVQYPALIDFLLRLEKSMPEVKMQFLIDPAAFTEMLEIRVLCGQPALDHVYYLTRTYTYYIYRQKQILLGLWTSDNILTKYNKKLDQQDKSLTNANVFPSNTTNNVLITGNAAPDDNNTLEYQSAVSPTSAEVPPPVHPPRATDQYLPVVHAQPGLHSVTSTHTMLNTEGLFSGQAGTWCCCGGVGCDMCTQEPRQKHNLICRTNPGFMTYEALHNNDPISSAMYDPLPVLGQAGVRDIGVGGLHHGSHQPHHQISSSSVVL